MKKERCQHEWDETNQFKQSCKKCKAKRFLMSVKYPRIGKPQIFWEIKDEVEFRYPTDKEMDAAISPPLPPLPPPRKIKEPGLFSELLKWWR